MKRFKILVLLALIGLLVTGSMTSKNHHLLFSDHAPAGILSLELTKSNSEQYQIFSEWNRPENYVFERDWKNPADSGAVTKTVVIGREIINHEPGKRIRGVDAAKKQTYADLGFIVFYVFSFILLFWYCYKKLLPQADRLARWQFLTFSIAVAVAGLLDFIEDFYIFQSISLFQQLNPKDPSPALEALFVKSGVAGAVFLPALFKFIILAITLIWFGWQMSFFKRLTKWLASLSGDLGFMLKVSWNFRIVLVVLLVLFGLLNFSDQGQDLLVSINTSSFGTMLFLLSISVFAAINWYLPKLYDDDSNDLTLMVSKGYSITSQKSKYYARLLGVLTFLIPATAILGTMQQYHMPYLLDDVPVIVILFVTTLFYQQILKKDGFDFFFIKDGIFSVYRYVAIMVGIFILMVAFYFIRDFDVEHYGRLSYLSLDLFLLSFAFMISVNYRHQISLIRNIQVAPVVLISGLVLALVFILFNIPAVLFNLIAGFRFFTLAIVIAALICYVLIFSYLLVLGRRTKVQWITLLMVIGILVSYSKMSNFHEVHLVAANKNEPVALSDHIRKWLNDRRGEINTYQAAHGRAYPVFFVNSYGGGIKAAAWATMLVGELDSRVLDKNKSKRLKDDFQHHVFSFSGASGGTVGFSLLVTDRLHAKDSISSGNFYPGNSGIYRHDYLTANIVGIFGRDVLMSMIGGAWYDDRARLQERGFETLLGDTLGFDYSAALSNAWKPGNTELPLLFSNTYDINTGKKGIVTAVQLEDNDFPSCIFVQNLIRDKKHDLPLSAAAFLSARFPFVSPTGKFDEKHHFTDGGTIENSGGETSKQVIAVFERVLSEQQFTGLKLSFNLISISSTIQATEYPVRDKNLYEILAPALGLLKTISSNALRADEINRIMVSRKLEEKSNQKGNAALPPEGGTVESWSYSKLQPTQEMIEGNWPVMPLGWQISDNALKVMKKSIANQRKKIDAVLLPFGE